MFKIREAKFTDAKVIAKLIDKVWKTSYKNILPDSVLEKRNYQQIQVNIEDDIKSSDKTVLVAIDNFGKIIGMVSGGICKEKMDGYDGELYAIYVLPEYQEQGVGKLLFLNFCTWLKENNFKSMLLWVLKANKSSIKFYEKIGGQLIMEKQTEIEGQRFDVVSYGWSHKF